MLRSSPLQLMGSGIGSLSVPQLLAATGEMLQAAGRQPETHRLCRRLKKSLLHKSWG
ncbi:putative quinone oxidoreductase [Klebsiella michiganensis]|nr:putative quinone oxidoreductase [Klebsiella michiganensis]